MRFYVGREEKRLITTGASGSGIFPTDESRRGRESHDAGLFSAFLEPVFFWIFPGELGGDPCDARLCQLVHFPLKKSTNVFSPGINYSSTFLSNLAQEFCVCISLF